MAMTAKQKRFCDEYLVDLNATQAAIRAGYSEKNANNIASENLAKPNIKKYISDRMAEKESELIATQDEVLRYLTSVLRDNTDSETIVIEGLGEGMSKARKTRIKPSEKDKLKAAELLGKRYALFTEKVEQAVDMDLSVNIDYGDGDG